MLAMRVEYPTMHIRILRRGCEELMYFHQILISDDNSVPELPYIDTVKDKFSNCEYKLWTNSDVLDLISSEFDDTVKKVYEGLVPYAYKADLAKYLLIHQFGGWFSDINNMMLTQVSVDSQIDAVLFSDIFSASGGSWSVTPSLMYGKRGFPIFSNAIDIVIKNFNDKYYGRTPLCPTGPVPLGTAIVNHGLGSLPEYIVGKLIEFQDGRFFTMDDGTRIARYKPNGLEGGNAGIIGTNNYNNYWYDRNVYGEKNA